MYSNEPPTHTHGRAKAGRPARNYIQQLCEDTGCSPEDQQEAMKDREEWREMVSDIRAGGTTRLLLFVLLLLLLFLASFLHQHQLMIFQRSLSHSKCPQVSKTLVSVLANLNNAVGRMVITRPLISKSFKSLVSILWWQHQMPQLLLVSPSLSCFTVFSVL